MRSSAEAGDPSRTGASFFFRAAGLSSLLLWCAIPLFLCPIPSFAQDMPPTTAAPTPAGQSESKQNPAELTSRDEAATFKVNVKLVVVRTVVRDADGHAVGNLRQEDFQVFDKGKPQVISQFEVEQPGAVSAKALERSVEDAGSKPPSEPALEKAQAIPERFVAYMFDDVHLEFGDLARTRAAAERHFATLRPTDRAAIFTTSGLTTLDFTDDREKLHDALVRLKPRPISSQRNDCPEISYYQADLILNK